jgi:hypothetical protein
MQSTTSPRTIARQRCTRRQNEPSENGSERREDLYADALAAVSRLWQDEGLDGGTRRDAMQQLRDEIDNLIDSLP